ncbi:cytochrome c [Thalassotalea psychrophila]|uniref:Cytochrome c n=1 Tax=Thalassotalea psychrophila TaxID=3065647 RepID=A0ABY9TUX4_9GAMM|nr:cytochrome c [Colwelliaceae bacterium SQ149]
MKYITILITCICLSVSFNLASASPNVLHKSNNSTDASNELSLQRQKDLIHMVKQDCGSCHGMTLKGGLGPSLLPDDLTNKPEYFLTITIMEGRPGTAMPPWKDILTEQEAKWIAEQLIKGLDNDQH